ncbi:glycoside hydrolase family 3 protein [Salinibacterium sp. ZJ70]|uniref:glycoside hydrolase family 3 protein n=1 Tax=Salinibacterium sp. ZJ70 TaxID=2708084 RepID=UPI001423E792|nr:glycoside hydrolase family 3 protein [Salinibacterium sp. ZJ70]
MTSTDAGRTPAELTTQLTRDEKIMLLEGRRSWWTNPVPRLGIPQLCVTDGPHGVRLVRSEDGAFGVGGAIPSTAFPTTIVLANTWSPANARAVGAAIAAESRARGVHVLLAPGVNIQRNPLCGRNFEYFSEDPLLTGVLASAYVQAVEEAGVGTSVKHFAANSNEDFRFVGDSVVDERALREIYLRAFERVVTEARPATVMAAYNSVNGSFASENATLLTGILREEWGFDGLVMTDWGATNDRVAGLIAGCELDMPGGVRHNRTAIAQGLEDGSLPAEVLDRAVERMLTLIERVHHDEKGAPEDADAHAELATRIAVEGAVLLQNDGALPLAPDADGLVVIGEMFDRMRYQGGGSSLIAPTRLVTPRDAFDARGVRYRYARGYRSMYEGVDTELEAEALRVAEGAETVLFFGGLGDLEECEGFDRTSLEIAEDQRRLIERLVDQGSRVVLVLFGGAPFAVPRAEQVHAVLDMFLPGQTGGEASARLLFGEAVPSGRLAQSWPRTAADASSAADFDRAYVAQYFESVFVGYRHHDLAGTDLAYPFGHGLSYTSFVYRDLEVRIADGMVVAELTVANTGERAADEVVQFYVRRDESAVFAPEKELRAFERVHVPASEERRVHVEFPVAELSYWDVADGGWRLENGSCTLLAAASAQDVRLEATFEVTSGQTSRSPYSPAVDAAYRRPPTEVRAAFAELVGREIVVPPMPTRLGMQHRIGDASGTLTGRLLHRAALGQVDGEYRRALRMSDSPERDAAVKEGWFLVRMMPTTSLRSLVMSSDGALSYRAAELIEAIANGHPLRGIRQFVRRGREERRAGVRR